MRFATSAQGTQDGYLCGEECHDTCPTPHAVGRVGRCGKAHPSCHQSNHPSSQQTPAGIHDALLPRSSLRIWPHAGATVESGCTSSTDHMPHATYTSLVVRTEVHVRYLQKVECAVIHRSPCWRQRGAVTLICAVCNVTTRAGNGWGKNHAIHAQPTNVREGNACCTVIGAGWLCCCTRNGINTTPSASTGHNTP